ncbi:probable serine/threonine-protein kinase DDB_G0283337 [Daktulosphaira vitifoliae]|uniref:probable serine/threonine-protein kinase DDB_G0283337 n=1 Tax=Daktulosphaira vitifoliae TaxID=58002 RepID=UPI0021AA1066|nr:probable serine/threonine-protein kinase DDB_G0283337 [Daktulosphaira vitifoliae]XP_050520308.1 probable serine/threonine-protein kinase DDB_G0283337 [Daktulosphaira vitifoliae]
MNDNYTAIASKNTELDVFNESSEFISKVDDLSENRRFLKELSLYLTPKMIPSMNNKHIATKIIEFDESSESQQSTSSGLTYLSLDEEKTFDPEKNDNNSSFLYCSLCCTYFENQSIESHNHSVEHRVLSQLVQSLSPSKDTLIYQLMFSNIFHHSLATTSVNERKMFNLNKLKNFIIDIHKESKKCIEILNCAESQRHISICEENNFNNNPNYNLSSNLSNINSNDNNCMDLESKKISSKYLTVPKIFLDVSTNTDEFNMDHNQSLEYKSSNKNSDKKKQEDFQIHSNTVGDTKLFNSFSESIFDQDNIYGQSVAERLNIISSISLKREIKLEIDRLFLLKTKKN